MIGLAARLSPYALAFFSSLCIMVLELVSSRLVASHVGASLTVWTSVIGVILGGICLGNVLGGRLADRVDPRRAVGPLFALGAFLTLCVLWINAEIPRILPSPDALSWELRTVLVVALDFLLPATVLGMVGPVVAKIAVEQSERAGSALGDVYFCGAVGSIVGTFLAGFILIYLAPTSVIVLLVAGALALPAAILSAGPAGRWLGWVTSALLGLGAIAPLVRTLGVGSIDLGSYQINYLAVAGNAVALVMAIVALGSLLTAPRVESWNEADGDFNPSGRRPSLRDLAILAFLISFGFMALEMVAGRLVARHLGSSVYGWTSVIGVLLAGLSVGNYLGGRAANLIRNEKQASWLFLIASALALTVLFLENQPQKVRDLYDTHALPSVLSLPLSVGKLKLGLTTIPLTWPYRVLLVVTAVFFLPAVAMGTVSPVVAKLAVDRLKRYGRTGTAIGSVYAWGMVGSILGTFLTGFVLIDHLGALGVLLALAAVMGLAATVLGTVLHAAWAGIPLGLCVIAFLPMAWAQKIGEDWGIREPVGDPQTTESKIAWVDESNYYYIKVENSAERDGSQLRTLVLDNLIHGYFFLGQPERLDYDYEHIYAMVAHRAAKAAGKIQPALETEPAPPAPGELPANVFAGDASETNPAASHARPDDEAILAAGRNEWIPKVESSTLKTLFLGGGAYTFQRHVQHVYPGTEVDVAEIDPAVTHANHMAIGLPVDTTIKTYWGDARQFVERHQDVKQYDIVFGDAFNDFSVPWHLTTREFNEKINKMLSPSGVYMINIIDAYQSDENALAAANRKIERTKTEDPAAQEKIRAEHLAEARRFGGFLGAWTATAKLTFPHVYIFGTDAVPGAGHRETFVVVASKQPLDLADLGNRGDDPVFFKGGYKTQGAPYGPELEEIILKDRSRGVILTDDYAPVENLLAPVAETRGDE